MSDKGESKKALCLCTRHLIRLCWVSDQRSQEESGLVLGCDAQQALRRGGIY